MRHSAAKSNRLLNTARSMQEGTNEMDVADIRPHPSPLAREIGLVLTIKLSLLALLWMLFFRAPPAVTPDTVGAAFTATTAAANESTPIKP